jgi:predicted regulator of Ras-like GTPase activity (Roadblock/LC7/MglB family)
MPLAGNLRDLALPDLIQQTCQDRRQARLSIQRGDHEATIYFDGGQVIHAEYGDFTGEEAVYRVLAWEEGDFNREEGIEAPEETVQMPWEALLMNGLQRVDEERWEVEEGGQMATNKVEELLVNLGEEVQGFIAGAVVGMDGLSIAEYDNPDRDIDMEIVSAQLTLLIKLVQTSVDKIAGATIEDNLLSTDTSYIVFRFLEGGDYFLGLVVDREAAKLGNVRLYSRVYAQRLNDAIPR